MAAMDRTMAKFDAELADVGRTFSAAGTEMATDAAETVGEKLTSLSGAKGDKSMQTALIVGGVVIGVIALGGAAYVLMKTAGKGGKAGGDGK